MIDYKTKVNSIATAVLQKMENHKWFLTEEMIPCALFAQHNIISPTTKQISAGKISSQEPPQIFRRGKPPFKNILKRTTTIIDLAGPESLFLFSTLNVSAEWPKKTFGIWDADEDYQDACILLRTRNV